MIKRTLIVSNQAYIHIHRKQLVIEQKGIKAGSIPAEDIGVLILEHPAITLSQAVLQCCSTYKWAIFVCDQQHLPSAITLPISGHSLHSKLVNKQAQVKPDRHRRLWRDIIRQKISHQATLLSYLELSGAQYLNRLASKVTEGDSQNYESQAASKYWRILGGDDFRRERNAIGFNSALNYGYSILRSTVARAICATGLHPALGINHHNQYNSFTLAYDLMEPFRPIVDLFAYSLLQEHGEDFVLEPEIKIKLCELLSAPVTWRQEPLPLMVAIDRYSASIKNSMLCKRYRAPEIPQWQPLED